MLKKTIKYKDFNNEEQSEDFYFHLSKAELVELELTSGPDGFLKHLQNIIKSNDGGQIIGEFKKIILMAYGKKSADNKSFIKSEELRQDFQNTAAYSELFMELATQTGSAIKFINGLVPDDLAAQVAKTERQDVKELEPNTVEDLTREVPAWIREDRLPTNTEAMNMTREELVEAYKQKNKE